MKQREWLYKKEKVILEKANYNYHVMMIFKNKNMIQQLLKKQEKIIIIQFSNKFIQKNKISFIRYKQ